MADILPVVRSVDHRIRQEQGDLGKRDQEDRQDAERRQVRRNQRFRQGGRDLVDCPPNISPNTAYRGSRELHGFICCGNAARIRPHHRDHIASTPEGRVRGLRFREVWGVKALNAPLPDRGSGWPRTAYRATDLPAGGHLSSRALSAEIRAGRISSLPMPPLFRFLPRRPL